MLGDRLEGRLREREWRWRLRERECLEDEYGLLVRDLADRLQFTGHSSRRHFRHVSFSFGWDLFETAVVEQQHSPDIGAGAQRLPVWAAGPPAVSVGTGPKLALLVRAVAAVAGGPAPVGRAAGRALALVAGVGTGGLWCGVRPVHVQVPAVVGGAGGLSLAPVGGTSSGYELVVPGGGLVRVGIGRPIGTFSFEARTSPVRPEVFAVISVRLGGVSVRRGGLFVRAGFTSMPLRIPFLRRLRGLGRRPFSVPVIAPGSISVVFRSTQAASTSRFGGVSFAALAFLLLAQLLPLLASLRTSSCWFLFLNACFLPVSGVTSFWR